TIIALGSYAYDWQNGPPAADLSFQEAMEAARDAGAKVQFDAATNNPHFSYKEENGARHDVWFLDGASAFNQIHAADAYQPAGYALWRLGSEDPTIPGLMGRAYNAPAPASLRAIPVDSENVDFNPPESAQILRSESHPMPALRTLEIEPGTCDIVDERYPQLPTNYLIRRAGAADKKLALTFDDGPDPEWTPQILDILKAKHVPATFFVIGANMEAHPGLV